MTVRAWRLNGFDDPALDEARWIELLHRGPTNVPYLTRPWQHAWWRTLGRGRLMLIAVEQDGHIVTVAPFYADEGIIFFVGSGHADYLDVLGDISHAEVLDALLRVAASETPDFCGVRLFAMRGQSTTGPRLAEAAKRLGWWCFSRERSPATRIDLINARDHAIAAANGPKVSKRERYFQARGPLVLREFSDPADIRRHLPAMFRQYAERWQAAGVVGQFSTDLHQRFLDELIGQTGGVFQPKLSCLEWQDRTIACEFAWIYRGVNYAVASSFAHDLAVRSPGQVLQRQVILASLRDGLLAYDFGEGDYPFKRKYATEVGHVETWELYPMPPKTPSEAPC